MSFLQRGLLLMAAAGAIGLPTFTRVDKSSGPPPSPGIVNPPSSSYEPLNAEYYLTADQVAWIRPGFNIKINGVTNFAPGQKPVVDVTFTDDLGQPLDKTGATTPGVISIRCVPAVWDPATGYYTNLLQPAASNPTRDANGTYTLVDTGHYKYTFGAALPSTTDPTKPHTLFVGGHRVMTDIIGKDYWAKDTFLDFVPSTNTSASTWAATSLAMCNACHDPLALHGGNYRDVKTCTLCHNPNNMKGVTSSGLDLSTFNGMKFWHNIHAGLDPDIPATFPQAINNCDGCHDAKAANGKTWQTKPGRTACGSCHYSVNFDTGEGHGGLPQIDDSKCASCHVPDSGQEWDASIVGAHMQNFQSKQLKGLKATITGTSNVKPGSAPTVVFKLTNGDGSVVDGTKLSTFSPIWAGPTSDYAMYYREDARAKAVFDATAGTTTYTFTNKIPANFKGTVLFTGDIYRTINLKEADGDPDRSFREAATNPIKYVSTSADPVVNRRTAVTLAQCNTCHDRLALHGEQRLVIEECVACHNPKEGDQSRRPADQLPKESVDFKRMIHRIHTGEEATQDITIYGFGGSVNNFNEVTFPGDRRNCVKCHTSSGYNPSDDPLRLDTETPRDYFTPMGPITTACLGCHDSKSVAAHAYLNRAPFGEACYACHGPNNDWSPAKVHAR